MPYTSPIEVAAASAASKENPEFSKSDILDYYPVVWTDISGTLEQTPFLGKRLVILGLDYMDKNNGLPKIGRESLSPGEHVIVHGDEAMELSDGSGGITLFILLRLL
ncbi:hypothetical protein BDV26DRAFT_204934 [Aspergillus bertholletiae]|uniref:Uncharacterized protein n=1 Tax=Aspergillus bertholletiae TaxID=1226010 RepID=A0A5N7B7R7_9EURO|nr:hypothetical protein BDV26DRAFT_204934 [Aspergillus bertholletiae]